MTSAISPQTVLITGATGGIGGALVDVYAEPGNTLILQGRNAARLAELSAQCEARGARVLTRVLDVRNRDELSAWLREVCDQEAVNLVIVNAGVNTNIGPEGKGERWEDIEALIEVNVLAAMATVDAVLPSMRARGAGQIALISSLAAYFGLPVTPSYCASKAAVACWHPSAHLWRSCCDESYLSANCVDHRCNRRHWRRFGGCVCRAREHLDSSRAQCGPAGRTIGPV